MKLFGKKKEIEKKSFDPEVYRPVLRCSICNGEQVAGFKDRRTGEFHEVSLIRNEEELRRFKETYGITELAKEY